MNLQFSRLDFYLAVKNRIMALLSRRKPQVIAQCEEYTTTDSDINEELARLEKRYSMSSKDFKKYVDDKNEWPPKMDECDCAFWMGLIDMKEDQ